LFFLFFSQPSSLGPISFQPSILLLFSDVSSYRWQFNKIAFFSTIYVGFWCVNFPLNVQSLISCYGLYWHESKASWAWRLSSFYKTVPIIFQVELCFDWMSSFDIFGMALGLGPDQAPSNNECMYFFLAESCFWEW